MSEFRAAPGAGPRPTPPPRPSRFSALLLWVIAGAGLVLTGFAGGPIARATAGMSEAAQTLVYALIYYLCFAALPLVLLTRRRPGLWRAYRPDSISLPSTLSIVALALLGVLLVTDLGALWSILLEALGLRFGGAGAYVPSGAAELALYVFAVAVLPAVCEEFVFRGAVLSAFERGGTRRAVRISALLFALLHGSLEGLPLQFLVGLILGWLVVYCDSIYAGLIYHTTHNAATILLQYALTRGAAPDAQAQSQSMWQAIGGATGMLQLLIELAVTGLMMFTALRMFRMTARLRGVCLEPPRPAARPRAREWALLAIGSLIACLLFALDLYAGLRGGAA